MESLTNGSRGGSAAKGREKKKQTIPLLKTNQNVLDCSKLKTQALTFECRIIGLTKYKVRVFDVSVSTCSTLIEHLLTHARDIRLMYM